MVDKQKKIWIDGEFIDWDEAKVHVLTHSLHYGLAAFDGMRAYQRSDGGTYVFRLGAHIERLLDTCKMCMIQPKFTREQLEQVCLETLRVNGMSDGYLRPMVFIGEGAMGIYVPQNPVHTAIIAWRWGAYLGDEALKNGIRAKIGSFARHHINVSLSKAKMNGQYTNSVLAKREAKLGGYDEAIMLDANGYVSEGSGENIFIVRRGVIYTPDLSCSILEGVTRDTVITLAREMGMTVVETRLTRDQLWLADEVFLTGTAAEVTPVREVDNRAIGQGTVGPLTKQIQTRFFDVVRGSDASHPEWLTRVQSAAPRRSRWLSRGARRARRWLRAPGRPRRPPPHRVRRRRASRPTRGRCRSTARIASSSRSRCPTGKPGASTTTPSPNSWRRTRPRDRAWRWLSSMRASSWAERGAKSSRGRGSSSPRRHPGPRAPSKTRSRSRRARSTRASRSSSSPGAAPRVRSAGG